MVKKEKNSGEEEENDDSDYSSYQVQKVSDADIGKYHSYCQKSDWEEQSTTQFTERTGEDEVQVGNGDDDGDGDNGDEESSKLELPKLLNKHNK